MKNATASRPTAARKFRKGDQIILAGVYAFSLDPARALNASMPLAISNRRYELTSFGKQQGTAIDVDGETRKTHVRPDMIGKTLFAMEQRAEADRAARREMRRKIINEARRRLRCSRDQSRSRAEMQRAAEYYRLAADAMDARAWETCPSLFASFSAMTSITSNAS